METCVLFCAGMFSGLAARLYPLTLSLRTRIFVCLYCLLIEDGVNQFIWGDGLGLGYLQFLRDSIQVFLTFLAQFNNIVHLQLRKTEPPDWGFL